MNLPTPLITPASLAALAVVALIGAVLFLPFGPLNSSMVQCDGSVPTWMVTDKNESTGCVELLTGAPPSDWDGSWICIGMCLTANPSPYIPEPAP